MRKRQRELLRFVDVWCYAALGTYFVVNGRCQRSAFSEELLYHELKIPTALGHVHLVL